MSSSSSEKPEPKDLETQSGGVASSTRSAQSSGVVSVAIMFSRVLGLIRELLLARLFGGGPLMDAFKIAFKIPNLLRDLFAEGALSMAFVTTFSKSIEKEGKESAWALANKIFTLAAVAMSVVTLLGILLAPWIVAVVGAGFEPGQGELTVWLARIMYPFLLMISLSALAMGLLNAHGVFGIPALASSFFNLGSIICGIGLGYLMDPTFGERALTGLAIGTLVGGSLQFLIQVPSMYKVGFRFRPDFHWNTPKVRKVLELMGPAVLAASAVQVNVVVNAAFATFMEDGAVAWLDWAFRFLQLPIGVFGVAVATVTLPRISGDAANEDWDAFRHNLSRGIRLALALTIPCTLGLMLLAEPIIDLVYGGGRMTAYDVDMTAVGLRAYVTGLAAYAVIKVLVPAFYAMDMKNFPMIVSFISIGVNACLNYVLAIVFGLGHIGLALSTGLVAITNLSILYIMMRHKLGRLDTKLLLLSLGKVGIASGVLTGVCILGLEYVLPLAEGRNILWEAGTLLPLIGVAGVLYIAIAWVLDVKELKLFLDVFLRRFLRRN